VRAGDDNRTLPSVEVEIASAHWGSAAIDRNRRPITEAIETLVYETLSQNQDGWENNDGSYGEFTFDVAERTIMLDFNERHMETDYSQHGRATRTAPRVRSDRHKCHPMPRGNATGPDRALN
jgi:hypothetical protein